MRGADLHARILGPRPQSWAAAAGKDSGQAPDQRDRRFLRTTVSSSASTAMKQPLWPALRYSSRESIPGAMPGHLVRAGRASQDRRCARSRKPARARSRRQSHIAWVPTEGMIGNTSAERIQSIPGRTTFPPNELSFRLRPRHSSRCNMALAKSVANDPKETFAVPAFRTAAILTAPRQSAKVACPTRGSRCNPII
jgi:hypothetical protein